MRFAKNTSSNLSPTANAGNDITMTLPTNSTTLTGSGTDPDGTIASYAWSRVSGPTTFNLGSANSATSSLTNLVQGVYVFRLTVTDNGGAIATDDITVTVNAAANQSPTANAGSDVTMTLPANSTTLTGSGTDPDGTIINYSWSEVRGPQIITIPFTLAGASATAALTNLVQGVYVFRLTVTDNAGATATDDVKVTVNDASQSSADPYFNIYPSPTSGILNIQYSDKMNGKFRMTIYDASMRLMKDEVIDKNQVSFTKTIDVSVFEAGIYFVEIISPENGKAGKQFVKL
jgi:hypothetical protein